MCVMAFALLAGPAHALEIEQEVDLAGDPVVLATAGTEPISWRACVGMDCRTFDGHIWPAGETAPGTVFTATAGGESASAPAWGGRVTATDLPALAGDAVVGGSVRPVAAHWTGGWGDEVD